MSRFMTGRRAGAIVFVLCAAVTSLFIINFCNWIYACGCTWLWAGGNVHCNIHVQSARHCPWCAIGTAGFASVFAAIVAAQAAVCMGPARWPWLARLSAGLAAFPASGLVLALLVGWWKGYWD